MSEWIPADPPTFLGFLMPVPLPFPVLPALAALLAAGYLIGAVRLWVQGRRWSVWRTVCFLTGCLVLAAVTGLGVEASRAETAEQFNAQYASAMKQRGPRLIEAMI